MREAQVSKELVESTRIMLWFLMAHLGSKVLWQGPAGYPVAFHMSFGCYPDWSPASQRHEITRNMLGAVFSNAARMTPVERVERVVSRRLEW